MPARKSLLGEENKHFGKISMINNKASWKKLDENISSLEKCCQQIVLARKTSTINITNRKTSSVHSIGWRNINCRYIRL